MLRVKAERIRRGWSQLDVAFHARIQPSELSRIERGLADGLVRLSVGIEDVADLIEDLDQAIG